MLALAVALQGVKPQGLKRAHIRERPSPIQDLDPLDVLATNVRAPRPRCFITVLKTALKVV